MYFVVRVSDEKTGKVSIMVNGWQNLGECLFECVLTIWCSSLLKDARAMLPVRNLLEAVC